MESSITINIKDIVFLCISCGFKHNHSKPYRHWRQDSGWHALPIVTHATASHRATQRCYSVAERCIPARCAALLQRWQLSLQRCKRYTKSCTWQRCATSHGSCPTLPNVIQRCAMLSHRCQTLSNVVTKLCVVVSKLCNVSSCTTVPLSNAVQRCYNVAKRYTTLCNVVTTLPNVIQRCATL